MTVTTTCARLLEARVLDAIVTRSKVATGHDAYNNASSFKPAKPELCRFSSNERDVTWHRQSTERSNKRRFQLKRASQAVVGRKGGVLHDNRNHEARMQRRNVQYKIR